jgi:hypothetical protein
VQKHSFALLYVPKEKIIKLGVRKWL